MISAKYTHPPTNGIALLAYIANPVRPDIQQPVWALFDPGANVSAIELRLRFELHLAETHDAVEVEALDADGRVRREQHERVWVRARLAGAEDIVRDLAVVLTDGIPGEGDIAEDGGATTCRLLLGLDFLTKAEWSFSTARSGTTYGPGSTLMLIEPPSAT